MLLYHLLLQQTIESSPQPSQSAFDAANVPDTVLKLESSPHLGESNIPALKVMRLQVSDWFQAKGGASLSK